MTQEELDLFVNGCAFMGESFLEQTKDIKMTKESRHMLQYVFSLIQAMFIREIIRRSNTKGLKINKSLEEVIKTLDNDKDLN